MAQRDFYEVLDVARNATADEIKKAYRRLARRFHPDVNPGDKTAEAKFKEAQAAYDALSDPETRKRYDTFGHAGLQGAAAGPNAGASAWSASQAPPGFETVDFHQFFGGGTEGAQAGGGIFDDLLGRFGARRSGSRQGADQEASLLIPFATSIFGGPTNVEIDHDDGSRETLEIRIPIGTMPGAKLRLKGRGAPGIAGGAHGDLTVLVSIEPHKQFRRDNNDLVLDLPVTVDEAVLGAKVDVPTLNGPNVSLTLPPGSSGGQKLRVRGKGVPAHKDMPVGDLFVVVKVMVPKADDDESKRLIREFAERNPMQPRQGLW